MRCPICGNEIPDQVKYCPACGASVKSGPGKKVICAVAGAAAVLIILAAGFAGFRILRANDDSEKVLEVEENNEKLDSYLDLADDYENRMEALDLDADMKKQYQDLVAELRRVQKTGDLTATETAAEDLKSFYETCAQETIRMLATGLEEVEMYYFPSFDEAEQKQFTEYEEIAGDYENKKDYPNAIEAYQRCIDYYREVMDKHSEEESAAETAEEAEAGNLNSGMSSAEVEEEVLRIRKIYNAIVAAKEAGQYAVSKPENGVTIYSDQTGVRCVELTRGYAGSSYARYYYYENQKLIFAYLEASDSHRLYFRNEQLFRWRYASKAAKASEAVNHDNEDSADFRKWGDFALQEAEQYKTAQPAQSAQTDNPDMMQRYQQIVKNLQEETEADPDGGWEFDKWEITDLNGDGVQELCTERNWNGHGETRVWIWKNNDAVEVEVPSVGNDQSRNGINFISGSYGHASGSEYACHRLNAQGGFDYVFGWSWTNGAYNGLGRDAYFENDAEGNHIGEITEAEIDAREKALGIAD